MALHLVCTIFCSLAAWIPVLKCIVFLVFFFYWTWILKITLWLQILSIFVVRECTYEALYTTRTFCCFWILYSPQFKLPHWKVFEWWHHSPIEMNNFSGIREREKFYSVVHGQFDTDFMFKLFYFILFVTHKYLTLKDETIPQFFPNNPLPPTPFADINIGHLKYISDAILRRISCH